MCGDEEGPDVMMVCVNINTECHRTCLGDVLAVPAPGALPEKHMANISFTPQASSLHFRVTSLNVIPL